MFHISRILSQTVSRRPVRVIVSVAQLSNKSGDRKEQRNPQKWPLLTIFAGAATFAWEKDRNMPLLSLPVVEAATAKVLRNRREQYNFISDVVEVSAPSVVYIEIQDTKRVDYFTGQPATASNGSGFVVDEDGLILTNAHVVINKPHSKVQVKLSDGRIFTGMVEEVDSGSFILVTQSIANLD